MNSQNINRNLLHCMTLFLFISIDLYGAVKPDSRSQFNTHAQIEPKIYSANRKKRDLGSLKFMNEEKLIIAFKAFNRNFVIELNLNKGLLPVHYFEKHKKNGHQVLNMPAKKAHSHCHYQGYVRDMKNSWAAINTCNGLTGAIYDGKELHYIQPQESLDYKSHLFFRASDLKPQNLSCGYENSVDSSLEKLGKLKRNRRSTVLQEPYKSNPRSRYVELIIVNDNREFIEFNSDENAVFQRSKEIANIVNGLYAPLNIFIALVGVIVWSENDEIKLSSDGDATLTNFLHYRRERLAQEHPNDNAQLITAITFDGGVVGKALKGPVCTFQYSGGVNMDHSHVVGLVATTVAHELGHNFGMEHDNDECQCPDEKCIMAPSSSSTSPRHWSSCSLEYLDLAFSQGMDYCLKNQPTDIIGPVCGNGFLEEGEQCDCGLKDFCDNWCCNASSCQLFQNATCAMGACCDTNTCQVKKIATRCRNAISECDLPEYCDGYSEFCPNDTYHQNGKECSKGKAYCYEGNCQSHADQCKLLWGQTGKQSDLRCYEQNYKGTVNGNCGYNRINQSYKACRKDDIMCGMLHCTHLNERLEFGMESAAILARSFINVRGKIFTCRSAIVDLGLFNTDPGLSPNGARCGDGKVCVNQKCLPVSSIKRMECQYDCSDNGVCNNRGNCHCNHGYAPPYCNSPGPGGSIDSGPAADPTSYFVIVLMYVLFLGLLPLIALAAAAVFYFRGHIKAWWAKKSQKALIKCRTKTNMQRRSHPSSKFNIDQNNLKVLGISAPIQVSSTSVDTEASTLPINLNKYGVHQYSSDTNQAFLPKSQSINGNQSNRLTPARPAPPRPNEVSKSMVASNDIDHHKLQTVISSSVCAMNSRNSSNCNAVSSSTALNSFLRPTCPPPRPPPPKYNLTKSEKDKYEEMSKNSECMNTNSSLYDDCQTLAPSHSKVVHSSFQEKKSTCEHAYHKDNKLQSLTFANNVSNKNIPLIVSRKVPEKMKFTDNSKISSLAQKFEKANNSLDSSTNVSLRPPFKSRPL